MKKIFNLILLSMFFLYIRPSFSSGNIDNFQVEDLLSCKDPEITLFTVLYLDKMYIDARLSFVYLDDYGYEKKLNKKEGLLLLQKLSRVNLYNYSGKSSVSNRKELENSYFSDVIKISCGSQKYEIYTFWTELPYTFNENYFTFVSGDNYFNYQSNNAGEFGSFIVGNFLSDEDKIKKHYSDISTNKIMYGSLHLNQMEE